MQGYWNHIPLFRFVIPLIAGIIMAIILGFYQPVFIYLFISFAVVFAVFQSFRQLSASFRLQIIHGVLCNMVLFFGGISIVIIRTPVYSQSYFLSDADDDSIFTCRITRPPEQTPKTTRLYVDVEVCSDSANTNAVNGKSILYILRDSVNPQQFQYGDIIYVRNEFDEPQAPKNPGEFNYQKYLSSLSIYHVAFLKNNDVVFSGSNEAKWQWRLLFTAKDYFTRLLEEHIKNKDALGVGQALILGSKSYIDDDIRQAYAHTGTMHILAVSGLHVGILFLILEMFFKPFRFLSKKRSRAALYKTIFILVVIWLYACLSGMSPSVMRSAVMFTFLAFGRLYDRHIDSFNIIFVSMIPLLVFNPWQITQVGFQLSYLAVAGIVFYQPLISRLWRPSNRLGKYIWSLTTVSIAAQLATAPVSLYYFHQFPNYFLISNMVAIPVSFTVLIFGVALFVFGTIPFISSTIGFLLDWNLRILNATVVVVDRFPYAVSEHIYISMFEMIVFYAAAILGGAFLVLKKKFYFIVMLILVFVSTVSISWRQYQNNHRREIIFYQTKATCAVALKTGTEALIFTDSDSLAQSADFTYHLEGDLTKQGIHQPVFIYTIDQLMIKDTSVCYYNFPFLLWGDKSFYFLTKQTQDLVVTNPGELDYVIITGNPFLDIDSISNHFSGATFIIDNNNSWKSHTYWVKKFDEREVSYVSVKRDGAFVIEYDMR